MATRHEGLEGKRVIVTAGASGIGEAIVAAFLDVGARVHICDVDHVALGAVREHDPALSATLADVADPAQVDALFADALDELGGLDVLVNNAGIAGPTGPIEELDPVGWIRTIEVNLIGMFHCLQRAVPELKRQGGGSIVNLSSTAGIHAYPMRTPYAASKWGVVGLSKTLAAELGQFGIRANAICPGAVEGPRIDRVIEAAAAARGVEPDVIRDEYTSQSSMRTFVTREDIARQVLFLCSDDGARISGQAIAVDGHTESLISG